MEKPYRIECGSAEPAPYHLRGLTNWLGRLIGFPLPHVEMGYYIFWCAPLFCLFLSTISSHKGKIESGERERAVSAKPLMTNISNKATGMFNKSELLETYPSEGFRWNRVKPGEMKLGVVWTRGTRSRHG